MSAQREQIISGDLVKTVWHLAWPNILLSLFSLLNMTTDRLFIAHLGEGPMAVVTAGGFYLWFFQSIAIGINVGTIALVSRFTGKQEPHKAEETGRQALMLGVGFSLLFTILSWCYAGPILKLMGLPPGLLEQGKLYYYPLIFSALFQYFLHTQASILRGLGDMITPLKVLGAVSVLCVLMAYPLIFGLGHMPPMGLLGAGLATGISRFLGAIFLFFYFIKPRNGYSLYSGAFLPSLKWFMRILRVGFPMVVQNAIDSLGWLVKIGILARTNQGVNAVAALGVGITVEGISFMIGFSYAIAAATMVGQNLGAGSVERAEQGAWRAANQGALLMLAVSAVFAALAYPLAKLFVHDHQAISLVCTYLWIVAPSEPLLGYALIFSGALEGAGDTWVPACITIFAAWVLRIPLIYYLCLVLNWGAVPAWVLLSVTAVIQGLLIMLRFKSGKWKAARV